MNIRTDLAMERAMRLPCDMKGVTVERETCHGLETTLVRVRTNQAAQRLGKPIGDYWTLMHPELPRLSPERCLSRKAGIVRCCLHFFPVVTRSAFLFLPTNCPCSRKVYRNFQLFHALFIRSSFLFFMIESIGGPYYRPQLEELLCTKPNSRVTPKRRPALYMP